MTAKSIYQQKLSGSHGFTLFELLVVVAIIAAVASIGIAFFPEAEGVADDGLARSEMHIIASAVRRFEQDTGYLPRMGPFRGDDGADEDVNGIVRPISTSPFNLEQLLVEPDNSAANDEYWVETFNIPEALISFNPRTGRGWNGPYLTEISVGCATIGDDFRASSGGYTSGAVAAAATISDPFKNNSLTIASTTVFTWRPLRDNSNVVCGTNTSVEEEQYRGRPYLLLVDESEGATVLGCVAPCIVSMGPNGEFENGGGDDIVVSF